MVEEKKLEEKNEKQVKVEEKSEKQNKIENKETKKTEAVVNGNDLRISTKHAIAICNFIRNKKIDQSIKELELVKRKEKAIPMRGEIAHKKGIMSGRYPIKAVNEFLILLRSLRSNAIFNELELEKAKISCMANIAARPYRRFGQTKFKRSHVQIKLM